MYMQQRSERQNVMDVSSRYINLILRCSQVSKMESSYISMVSYPRFTVDKPSTRSMSYLSLALLFPRIFLSCFGHESENLLWFSCLHFIPSPVSGSFEYHTLEILQESSWIGILVFKFYQQT